MEQSDILRNYIQEMIDIQDSSDSNKECAFRKCRLNYLVQLNDNIPRNLTREELEKYRTIRYEIVKIETDIVIDCCNHEREPFITCKQCGIKMRKPHKYEVDYLKSKPQQDYSKINCIEA